MSKNNNKVKVKWFIGDGVQPTRRESDGCFELLLALPLNLQPGENRVVDLGVRCDHAVHVIPAWEKRAKGLELVDGIWAAQDADPNNNLKVTVKNVTSEMMLLDRGGLIARCIVFSNHFIEVDDT